MTEGPLRVITGGAASRSVTVTIRVAVAALPEESVQVYVTFCGGGLSIEVSMPAESSASTGLGSVSSVQAAPRSA